MTQLCGITLAYDPTAPCARQAFLTGALSDPCTATQVASRLRSSVLSKQPSYGDVLCPLIAQACIAVCPPNAGNFDVDNVRVCKIPGGGVSDSSLVRGVMIRCCPGCAWSCAPMLSRAASLLLILSLYVCLEDRGVQQLQLLKRWAPAQAHALLAEVEGSQLTERCCHTDQLQRAAHRRICPVCRRGTEGTIKSVKDAKVVAFVQGVDTSSTETKVRRPA